MPNKMNIVRMPISELKPAEYNPRVQLKKGDAEYEKLKRSIENFGYVEPIIFNKTTGNVVGGHQRLNVLLAMEESEIDVVVVELDPDKEKALNVALNKITGEWDNQKLDELLRELSDVDLLAATGFSEEEYEALISRVDINDFFGEEPEERPAKEGKAKKVTCPHCGEEFEL